MNFKPLYEEIFHLYRTPVLPVGTGYFPTLGCRALIYYIVVFCSIQPSFHVLFEGTDFSFAVTYGIHTNEF